MRARDAVVRLREQAVMLRAAVPLVWFAELDSDFGVSEPLPVPAGIEEVVAAAEVDVHIRPHLALALWPRAPIT